MKMFILPNCPYCQAAIEWLAELKKEEKYAKIDIELIDESKEVELANQYDYYYVPSIFDGQNKLHEGATTLEELRAVCDTYLSSKQ